MIARSATFRSILFNGTRVGTLARRYDLPLISQLLATRDTRHT